VSQNKRSFWSSIPGLITGIAGLLTAVAGIGTLAVQQGIIGGNGSNSPATTAAPGGAGATATTTTTEEGAFTVSPTLLTFKTGEREKTLTVKNPTRTARITVTRPQFTGADASVFEADAGCTNVRLEPGRSCTVKVLFAPSGLLKSYKANLVLEANGGSGATEVPIEASTLL